MMQTGQRRFENRRSGINKNLYNVGEDYSNDFTSNQLSLELKLGAVNMYSGRGIILIV